ncbi:hypothetical protein OG439_36195 [Amycolatopsis sp. NBC_01307]|uniref:hypothetical protein n=1 Tax=Amycolatopsis sp. NBC_01307 TaxID=2903561 RepID=UPI002E0E8548|nr:hypothetical protein OG439_36195 [Amycolatopsis sp. NBC_01307]
MALFSRKRETSLLPADIVDRVVGYIRTEAHSPNAPASFDTPGLIYSLHSTAHADPALFIEKLASAVLPAGGEASRGGARVVWELLTSEHLTDPNCETMLDAGLDWLRATGVSSAHLFGYEIGRWHTTHGSW